MFVNQVLLGKGDNDEYELLTQDATLQDTLEKLSVLHEAGAHPTEIVGLSEDGDFLISKQPLAFERGEFQQARDDAVKAIQGVISRTSRLRTTTVVIHIAGEEWLVSDLHERNIMQNHEGRPTIIDALIGPVTPGAKKELQWLTEAADDAKALRKGRPLPKRSGFDAVSDEEL